jgi:excisionase family DNA binding protein
MPIVDPSSGSWPADIESLDWAANRLGISKSTAYRLAKAGDMPGAFQAGHQWRVSVPRFWAEVHGDAQNRHQHPDAPNDPSGPSRSFRRPLRASEFRPISSPSTAASEAPLQNGA